MKLWKIWLLIAVVLLTLISQDTAWAKTKSKVKEVNLEQVLSGNGDVEWFDFGSQKTIATFQWWKTKRSVIWITDMQNSVMNELKIPFKTQLYLRTIVTSECWLESGFCLTRNKKTGKTVDCGFYQQNQIHGDVHKWCVGLVLKWQKEELIARKTWDWSNVNNISMQLFKWQTLWVFGRMKDQVKRYKLPEDREVRMKKICILHNGSSTRYDYGNKCVKQYRILRDFYKKAWFNVE